MGKAKPKHKTRKQKNRSQPNGIQVPSRVDDVQESEENELSQSDEASILNIIEEIQSPNIEEKLCGLQSLVTLAVKPESVDVIIKNKAIKIIGPMLIDKNSEIRNLTAGVLRNLSASGSAEVCERLVKDDVMTPLVALLQQYNDWTPSSSSEDTDTLLQVVNILWNLCEIDETALKYFMSANLLSILLKCLDYNVVGLDLSIAVCQCLNSVLEDNVSVAKVLRSHEGELMGLLGVSAVTNKLIFLKTLVAGIVVNLNLASAWLPQVLAVLKEALDADLRGAISQLSSQLPLDSDTELTTGALEQLDSATALAEAQTMALEILTNVTASQDDEMDAESEDCLSEAEDEANCLIEDNGTQPVAFVSSEISEGVQKYDLVSAVLSKLDLLPENVIEIITSSPCSRTLDKKIVRLQCRVFLCLNNLISAVDISQFGGVPGLVELVPRLTTQKLHQFKTSGSGDLDVKSAELLEALTSAIRAVLYAILKTDPVNTLMQVSYITGGVEMFIKLGEFSEPRVQANVIRIVGIMGMLIINQDGVTGLLGHQIAIAGEYLLKMAEKEVSLWLTAEALDSLMDLFSNGFSLVFTFEIGLIPRLEAILPRFKTKVRKERRTLGEHYPVVSTVLSNLRPFINYQKSRAADLEKRKMPLPQ